MSAPRLFFVVSGSRKFNHMKRIYILIALLFLGLPGISHAYIGPGAGFAFISSFFILIIAFILAFFTIVSWPLRAVFLYVKRRTVRKNSKVGRLVVVGLDGLDPELCREYMERGNLPNFKKLGEKGCFKELKTTCPSISPVAWSTFATGVNPGKHNIFDFFTRDPKNYMPVLSSAQISSYQKVYKLGPIKIPVNKTAVTLLRKSTSMWSILGKSKVFSTVLRVPITFPPEKFYGVCLSAMCAPDLIGTQGSYTLFTSEKKSGNGGRPKGNLVFFRFSDNAFWGDIKGPVIKKNGAEKTPVISLKGILDKDAKEVQLFIGKDAWTLKQGEYSPWIKLQFKVGVRKQISGLARFLVTETDPNLKIYMTPINIDPEKPNLPVSHPFYYSICLSKLNGPFSTLGLAEDTWALNDGAISEKAFLDQAYDIYEERKTLLMDNLKRNKEGLLTLVFDTTDRIQHMFFRYLSDDHPANKGKDIEKFKDTIPDLYGKMDDLVGEILEEIDDKDLLMIISDHGFKSFKWGVNLNTWLFQEGYLVLREGATPGKEWFEGVDWTRTTAYAYGLSGIFINTRGREKLGVIEKGKQKKALIGEIRNKLEGLFDSNNNLNPVRRAIPAMEGLKGPYVSEAPDILVGYTDGYRASWNCATGTITDSVFEENTKCWSGDHCIDPDLVPGVYFSNWKLKEDDPALMDLAPTILHMFGLKKQRFHDGRVLNVYQ